MDGNYTILGEGKFRIKPNPPCMGVGQKVNDLLLKKQHVSKTKNVTNNLNHGRTETSTLPYMKCESPLSDKIVESTKTTLVFWKVRTIWRGGAAVQIAREIAIYQ